MAKRETYTIRLHCEKCGATGTASGEENENPVHSAGYLGRRVSSVSKGFSAAGLDAHGDQEIICNACQRAVSF